VISLDGRTVYHSGDTGVFGDMKLIPELFGPLDVALLPIGGHFTMDIRGAAKAVELLNPKLTIPIHYNTWPPIEADPVKFAEACQGHEVKILEPGQSITI
jgi:L-ascorbate metabolism protein UlaG (beta-lactamase superfamily)